MIGREGVKVDWRSNQTHERDSPRSLVGVSGGRTGSTHLDVYRLVEHGGRLRGRNTHTHRHRGERESECSHWVTCNDQSAESD